VNWLLKAAVQKGISALPNAEAVNYVFQRRVTRSLPIGGAGVRHKFGRAVAHFRVFDEHGPARPPAEAAFYEFGAGWDLAVPLAYAALGVGRQVLVDIRPNVRLELVNSTLASLARQHDALAADAGRELRDLGPPDVASADELEERFGIAYLAPRDARATGLSAASIDFVSSTNTLEHVPERDIVPILRECARLLRADGVMSFRIDMQDHASYADPRVSPYHFLRFSDRAWRLLTSGLGYQNRLRLPDYRRVFHAAGLETISETVTEPTPEHLAALARVELAPQFRSYTRDELAARALEVVVRPRLPDRSEELADVGDGGAAGVRPRAGP
jgi:SAM-dependent methyltransferase